MEENEKPIEEAYSPKKGGNPFVVLLLLFGFLFSPLAPSDAGHAYFSQCRLSAAEFLLSAPAFVSSQGQTQKLASNSRVSSTAVRSTVRGTGQSFDKLIIVKGEAGLHRSLSAVCRRCSFRRSLRLPSFRGFSAFSRPPPSMCC